MLSAWIRIFEPENKIALGVAKQWGEIVEKSFSSGQYSRADDIAAFTSQFGRKPKSGFETGFGMFYHAALLKGVLSPATENLLLQYYLTRSDGIYYIYDKCLNVLPDVFASKRTSQYLAAIELVAGYGQARGKLGFVAKWLDSHKDKYGQWDLGAGAKDGVYFPLSDSWRKREYRIADCTERITNLMQQIF